MDHWTHADLVALAAKWLASQGHSVVATEIVNGDRETPDAIGFVGRFTTLIECKVSLSDLSADRRKSFRRIQGSGMGDQRYYLAPPGLLCNSKFPDGWGLLEPSGRGLAVVRAALHQPEKNHRGEMGILVSLLRRVGYNAPEGVKIKVYRNQFPVKQTTLTVTEAPSPQVGSC